MRILLLAAVAASALCVSDTPSSAAGWRGDDRMVTVVPFRRGVTLERIWIRLDGR